MLDDEINDVLQKLDADFTTLITKCKFFEKPHGFEGVEKERELRILATKKKKKKMKQKD